MGELVVLSKYRENKKIEALKKALAQYIGHITHYESPVFLTLKNNHNIKNILCTLPLNCVKY